ALSGLVVSPICPRTRSPTRVAAGIYTAKPRVATLEVARGGEGRDTLQSDRSAIVISLSARVVGVAFVASTGISLRAAAQSSVVLPGPSGRGHVKFEIRVPAPVRNEPLTGREYVIFSTDSTREPRTQIGRVGAPLFGRDVEKLAPGAPAVLARPDLGTPVFDMADIPAGDYWIQPFVSVYSEFKRADGHVLWMHDDQWEGQNWPRSPGNIYGAPQKVHFDPKATTVVKLVADKIIPAIQVAADNEFVQRFKFQSPSLT